MPCMKVCSDRDITAQLTSQNVAIHALAKVYLVHLKVGTLCKPYVKYV